MEEETEMLQEEQTIREMEEPTAEQESPPPNSDTSGLPVMVPVSVRSDLPEFLGSNIERVLVGLELTWIEFLALFQIELDSSQYIVKGTGGRQAFLTDRVGDYVNTLKRRMKVYPVTIEKINPSSSSPPRRVNTSPSPNQSRTAGKRKVHPPKWNLINGGGESQQEPPNKVPLLQEEQSVNRPSTSRNFPTSSESQNQPKKDNPFVLPHPVNRKSSFSSKKMSPAVAGPSKPNCTVTNGNPNNKNTAINGKRDDADLSDFEQLLLPTDLKSGSFGRLPDDFEIKPSVIQFLVTKISNKNMLRIRDELLQLKTQDDYFQLTCVAPLAAGLLDQMLCRTQPGGNP